MAAEAIRHALAAEDFERVVDLIERTVPEMRRSRQEATLLGWLQVLPDELFRCRPVLSVHYAGTLLQSGQLEGVEARLRDVERWLDPTADRGEIVIVDEENLLPLQQALTPAEPEGYVRIFVDEGPPMTQLLERMNASREGGRIRVYSKVAGCL